MKIPSLVLRQLYTYGSLMNESGGIRFTVKNRLSDARLVGLRAVRIDKEPIPIERVTLHVDERELAAGSITPEAPVEFPLRRGLTISIVDLALERGKHTIEVSFEAEPFGRLDLKVKDSIAEPVDRRPSVPYDRENDYTPEMIRERRRFVEAYADVRLDHLSHFSVDPDDLPGNVENFTGVAQIPIGIAGPLRVNGEHADGEYLIPLATTEGTLVASYNRGIKALNLAGGVTCTVSSDYMQRAPVFVFDSAREAREFRRWVDTQIDAIREAAEATSSVAKLIYIDTILSNKFAFLRFNYTTGDAAGQNMVGRATFAACSWILEQVPGIRKFYLESNLATDKKTSQINTMRTRGKRVTAEATLPREVMTDHMRVEPRALDYHGRIANVGAFLSGANNNGCHSPNAITALFIATGQDVANVSESSSGILYSELTPEGDLYLSLTIPSLIVATYGGGTGLATQNECLQIMQCAGQGKVRRFAEIVAGVALAGEISLGSAISSLDWVSSHEQYGRNR